ncbi:glycerophosphodiester phosphodiesterase [Streptomyces sp. B1I3]|uniref:glycerophosphodiester phosphodiesterase n=1 Tax=Streptomyces sp. B1I3 TaxID=3042264 RepID=UPI00277D5EB4|nr:glycerophosphodiester phosphodiesterase [Streptomyces sp. B1I3]MDQ0791988.1 glycerophosphoryl diester phosphodiesterase [Streptomyces sp. B1I3]
MALPDDLPTVTLTGTYTHPDGSPMKGSVSITPVPGKIVAADSGLTVQGRAKQKFDGNGAVSLTVLATDAAGINPENFTYRVTIAFPDATGDSFFIALPASAPTVQLPAITPASPSEGDYVVVTGPAGPEGPAGTAGEPGPQGQPGPPGSNADAEQYTDDAVAAEATRSDAAYDPTGAAATARTQAISTAADDATTKAAAAQAAATGTASADATSKANAAQAAAAIDATTKAAAAQAAAISTAAADATTKAGTAQSTATTAAASDATSKANAAQAAAISTASSDATTKANAAQSAAVAAASSDATTKANAAQAAATTVAAGDATTKAGNAQTAAVSAAATSAATLYLPSAIQTIDSYLAGASPASPRFFAHRGGGMVRPEHTMAGYRASAAQGFPPEVSANIDGSGELWCIHDPTMDRTTYKTGAVNSYLTEEIGQQVLTNGRVMLGPGWTEQPMVPLRQVLDEFLGKIPIFLEAKGNDAVVPTQTLLSTYYPHAPRSVIWKCHIGTASLPWAKDPSRNYKTWVYLDDGTSDAAITAKDQYIDYLGVSTTMADARVAQIVARGKPVFSWPVYRRSQVARLTGLGVVGIMASDPRYVSTALPQRTASRWDLQVKESGGTPGLDYDATYSLLFAPAPDVGWVSINALPNQSYGLGTYAPVQGSAAGYRIAFDMKYKTLPAATVHGGFYFGKAADDGYRFSTANASGGYHVVMRASGDMQLYRHTAGSTTGTQIGSTITTPAPIADTAMSFQINVTPTTVELKRTDGAGWTTGPIADTTYRGGYLGLSNGSITDLTTRPYWRNLVITQL